MSDRFPVPFAGIAVMVPFESPEDLRTSVQRLLRCGHQHNFAVAVDGLRIFCSEQATACFTSNDLEDEDRG